VFELREKKRRVEEGRMREGEENGVNSLIVRSEESVRGYCP